MRPKGAAVKSVAFLTKGITDITTSALHSLFSALNTDILYGAVAAILETQDKESLGKP